MFKKVDQWLLNQTERLVDVLQNITGKNNFFFAKLMTVLMAVLGVFMHDRFIIVMSVVLLTMAFYLEHRAKADAEVKTANVFRETGGFIRVVAFIGILVLPPCGMLEAAMGTAWSIEMILSYAGLMITTVFMYLISCDTKPPCKSWFRRLAESRSHQLVPIPVESR